MQIFTPDDLLQYVYNETSPEKTAAIKSAVENDWALQEKLELIRSATQRLEPLNMSPRNETISKIMEYAEKSVAVHVD